MYTGQMIFSQIIDFLPQQEFRKCVQRYRGNYKVQKFSCNDQFLCMAFAQLTYRESLRSVPRPGRRSRDRSVRPERDDRHH